ncbi:MAG: hypothetical protein HOV94_19670 [Saccharothrix sp.]|nr:hypothetical protein [Saccharothrix sp.]
MISVGGSGTGGGTGFGGTRTGRGGAGGVIRIVGGSGRLTCTVGGSRSASSSSTVGHDGSSGTQSSAVEYGQRHTLGKGLTRRRSPH